MARGDHARDPCPPELQSLRAKTRHKPRTTRLVPKETLVITLMLSFLTLIIGLVVGFIWGAETAQTHKPAEPDTLSPAERRRMMNRPWT